MFADEMMQLSFQLAESGALFRERLEDIYRQARERTDNAELEILTSGAGEFLIGDIPALTVRRDRDAVGVLGGIALDDATSVFMPLGPKHVAGSAEKPHRRLSAEQVRDVIVRQVVGAIEYVYLRQEAA